MKSVFKNRQLLFLCLVTLLGGILRFWKLGSFPVSPNWDEVSHGYNAYSILKTGMDEWGKSFPLIFRAFGDYKLPLYIYLTTIPVWLFGLSVFSVRFISALAGTLAIPAIYLLVKELDLNKKNLPTVVALLLAVSPWHFFISRPALEANLSLTLIIFGFYFLLRFFNKKASLLPSVIFLGLALHTYNTARVFVPLMVFLSFIIYKPSLRGAFATKQSPISSNLKNLFAVVLAILASALVLFQVFAGEGTARYEKLKILSPSTVFQIGESLSHSTLPPVIAKIIYNKPVFFTISFLKNYLGYFSPQFFYQTWGAQFQFAIPGENLLSLPVFLLAIFGFLTSLSLVRHSKSLQFLYSWLLLSPVAASLTIDPPQALRPNPMIPALIIFAGLGFYRVLNLAHPGAKKVFTSLICFWILLSYFQYLQNYFGDYSQRYSSSWQYGYSQAMSFITEHQADYDHVFITKRYGEPHIFYAFFSKLAPIDLQPGTVNIRFNKSDWFWTDKINQIYFVNDWQIPTITVKSLPLESGQNISTAHSLLITSPDHVPVNAHLIQTINFLDGTPAYIITSIP